MEEGLGAAMRPSLSETLRPPSPELWDTMEKKKGHFLPLMVYFSQQHIIKPVSAYCEKHFFFFS